MILRLISRLTLSLCLFAAIMGRAQGDPAGTCVTARTRPTRPARATKSRS